MRIKQAVLSLTLTTSCLWASVHADPPSPLPLENDLIPHSRPILDDPSRDGWDTEVFSNRAAQDLSALVRGLVDSAASGESQPPSSLAPEFHADPLRPARLDLVYQDPTVHVRRPAETAGTPEPGPDSKPEPDAWRTAIKPLLDWIAGAADLHHKIKVIRVSRSDDRVATVALFHLGGRRPNQGFEINATWSVEWTIPSSGPAKLVALRIQDYEEVESIAGGEPWFSDCTRAAIGHHDFFAPQLLAGVQSWLGRMEVGAIDFHGFHGLAVGDVNGDGLDDVYVCQPNRLPNRLLLHAADGKAHDVSAEAGVDWLDSTLAALIVDLDNDGAQDLVVATLSGLLIHAGDGKGRFKLVRTFPDLWDGAVVAADYDLDGDLDLYVLRYRDVRRHTGEVVVPLPYHDANNGGRNVLLRNEGDWTFSDATAETGLDQNNRKFSLAACWEDFDDDGDPDLLVANDYGRSNLYRNDAGRFVDVAEAAGVGAAASGMSADWADYDGDGRMDLYVGNMFSSAGNRITFQHRFMTSSRPEDRKPFQRMAQGNNLYHNMGDGTFRDVGESLGVAMGRWSWASKFVDWNNDGWEDLVVANGYLTNDDPKDL